jgi:3'-phosphoadenosine 5'-phosphosulfate sulfotransferase (PAPS reductase)/FAD synthetase
MTNYPVASKSAQPLTAKALVRALSRKAKIKHQLSVDKIIGSAHKNSKAQHLVSVSGGKDSTATYLLAMESGRPFRAVFADTGNEHELTYEYISRLPERTGGPKIEVVRADFSADLAERRVYVLEHWPNEGISDDIVQRAADLLKPSGFPFLDLCMVKQRFPSSQAQFCTEELKQIPIATQMVGPMLRNAPVLQWLGIRSEESKRRARQPRFNHDESGSMVWRPIFDWVEADVWAMHRRHALHPNPLYALDFGRVGCRACINSKKKEVYLWATRFPIVIDVIREWEFIVAAVSKRLGASWFAPINGDVLPIDQVVEWSKTTRGGRQYAMFFDQQPGGGCSSDHGLCERAA